MNKKSSVLLAGIFGLLMISVAPALATHAPTTTGSTNLIATGTLTTGGDITIQDNTPQILFDDADNAGVDTTITHNNGVLTIDSDITTTGSIILNANTDLEIQNPNPTILLDDTDGADATIANQIGTLTIDTTVEIDLTASAGTIDINAIGATAGDVTINSGDDMLLTAVGLFDIDSAGTVTIDSAAGEFDITAEAGAVDINAIGGANDVTIDGGNSVLITAATAELDLTASAGAIDINAIGATAGDVTIDSGDDMTVTAVGILSFNGATMGFFGTTPGTAAPDYTTSNVITTRIFNADGVTLATTNDVLATVIDDLILFGLFQ